MGHTLPLIVPPGPSAKNTLSRKKLGDDCDFRDIPLLTGSARQVGQRRIGRVGVPLVGLGL